MGCPGKEPVIYKTATFSTVVSHFQSSIASQYFFFKSPDHFLPISHIVTLIMSFFGKRFFFDANPFKSLYWICYNIASVVSVLDFWPWVRWDLRSLTRDWTLTSCLGRQSLNPSTTREVPDDELLMRAPWTLGTELYGFYLHGLLQSSQ